MSLRDLPIKRKLTVMLLLVSGVVLLLTCASFFAYEFVTFRQATVHQLSTLGQVTADNSTAALAFNNPADANEILAALRAERHIVAAGLYDKAGKLFSKYPAELPASAFPAQPGQEGYRFEHSHLAGFQSVAQKDNKPVGTLYLKSDLGAMYERFRLYGSIAGLVIVVALIVAYLLSSVLQKQISGPIMALAGTARAVSDRRDYSVRATKFGQDELGLLTDAFNQMLGQIGVQDQALRESQNRLNLALKSSGVGTWSWDIGENRIVWDDFVPPLFGLKPGTFSGQYEAFASLIHPGDRERVRREMQVAIKNGGAYESSYRAVWPDGTIRNLSARGKVSGQEDGQKLRMIGVCWDITEQKEAEAELARHRDHLEELVQERTAALRESQDRYRTLFDSIDEGFCIIEMIFDAQEKPVDYRFLEFNPAFERQTGLHDALGKRMREFAPQHEEHWFETYGRIAMTGEAVRFQNHAEQLHRWYDVYACRFGDPKNRQVAIVFSDITERKAAEANIAQLNTDLQQRATQLEVANKELESFSYSVSHDLRAPLRHVQGYAEMLAKATAGQLSPKAVRYVQTITDASVEMGQLIDDLLDFSRMSRAEMQETDVDLDQLVQQTLHSLELATKDRNIVWKIAPLPPGLGDRTMLRQVFANLIGNAVKYSRQRDPAEIEIGCAGLENGRRIYFVRDNGAGFDMQFAHKLFGVFQRLHRPEDFEGTGIGLATVRRILVRHGDRIWAESAPDQGATFYFTLRPATPI